MARQSTEAIYCCFAGIPKYGVVYRPEMSTYHPSRQYAYALKATAQGCPAILNTLITKFAFRRSAVEHSRPPRPAWRAITIAKLPNRSDGADCGP